MPLLQEHNGIANLDTFLAPIRVSDDKLFELADAYVENYTELARSSSENFLVTPLTSLPDGSEKGTMLAVDMGGSRARVALVLLRGLEAGPERRAELLYKRSHNIEALLKGGSVEPLFDWLGICILESLIACDKLQLFPKGMSELQAGLTFSFPMM